MHNYKLFFDKIKGLKKVYLAGGIQGATRPDSWRVVLKTFFEGNGVEAFNPVDDNAGIFNKAVLGYKEDGAPISQDELQDVDELKEALLYRQTEINDKKAIKDSDVVIFYLDERVGHGTMTEFDWCYDMKKPVVIIRRCSRKDLAHWNKWRRYLGIVVERNMIEFKNMTDLKNFFMEYLNFKDVEGSTPTE